MKKKYLGLDLGTKTCGVAISDITGSIVFPKCLLKFKNGDYDSLYEDIKKIVIDEDIGTIVIGLPINMDGTKGFAAQRTYSFIEYLEKLNVVVATEDERLTTVEASRYLHESGLKEIDFKDKIDIESAVIILESYLRRIS